MIPPEAGVHRASLVAAGLVGAAIGGYWGASMDRLPRVVQALLPLAMALPPLAEIITTKKGSHTLKLTWHEKLREQKILMRLQQAGITVTAEHKIGKTYLKIEDALRAKLHIEKNDFDALIEWLSDKPPPSV